MICDPDERAYDAFGLVEGRPSQLLFDAPEEFWAHSREIGVEFQRQWREQGRLWWTTRGFCLAGS